MTVIPEHPRCLALVGMPGSGKSLCAEHLQARGYFQFRFGKIVVDEVIARGWEVNSENERIVREELRAKEGMAVMAQRALPHLLAGLETHHSVIIDGLYSFSEYTLLKEELDGLVIVAVFADRDVRYARLATREERPLTAEEAQKRDFDEIRQIEKGGPIALADFTLLNNGEPEALLAALDALLERLALIP
jgi:dephospho-CoA kinase